MISAGWAIVIVLAVVAMAAAAVWFTRKNAEMLERNRRALGKENREGLSQLLEPLRDQITTLKKDLNEYRGRQESDSQRFVKGIDRLIAANKQVSDEASRLANALLSNNKIQGDWGENVLKRILDLSGLQEGRHYRMQVTRDHDGRLLANEQGGMLRPDCTLTMPNGDELVIDSKVSLTAYVNYVNAATPSEQAAFLKQHVESVKRQVNQLSGKRYTQHMGAAAHFALMFVPNDPAYLAAMQADATLWEHATEHHVVIVSPTHMLSVAQLLMQMWSRDAQDKNSEQILKEVMKLMDKLDNFTEDLNKIQSSITAMQNTYDKAMTKLRGKGGITAKGNEIKRLAGLKSEE